MIVIKNGWLIDPKQNLEGAYDLLIDQGKVAAIEKRNGLSEVRASTIIDAANSWVVPGLIDLHVHFREPGFEWKETIATGSTAAVLGGYTSVCCMPNTRPTNDTAEVTRFIVEQAAKIGLARVLPIGSVTQGLKGEQLSALTELHKAGCVAFSDDGEPVFNSGIMRRALEWCSSLGLTISCHEEDKCLTCGGCMNESGLSYRLGLKGMPTVAEDVMVARDIELALYTGGKVHICHVSSARSVELIRRAKADGINITCEVTPHHLLLTEAAVSNYDTNFKMRPPLRTPEIQEALWQGLQDGTIDAIASDHAPHERDSKNVEFELASMGILGLQTSLPLMLEKIAEEKITKIQAIKLMSTGPADCFGLSGGGLSKGSNADICIIDPEVEWVFAEQTNVSKSVNSPFWGRKLRGRAETVLVNGKVVVAKGSVVK